MIYLSLKNEKEKRNIIKVVKELHINCNIYEISSKYKKKFKKSKVVICTYNPQEIKKYIAQKKIIIVNLNNSVEEEFVCKKNVYAYNTNNELKLILKCVFDSLENLKKAKKVSIITFTTIFLSFLCIGNYCGINFFESSNNNVQKELTNEKEKIQKAQDKTIDKEAKNINKRRNFDLKKENIVFYGDSITDYYDLEKYYKNIPVINSGTAGYQTKNLLSDIDKSVVQYNPSKVFILIGTNDIAFTNLDDEEIADNIIAIATKIKEKRPNAQIFIESIYPISKEDNDLINLEMVNVRDNKRIKNINSLVKEMCDKEKYVYIDLYEKLVNKDDNLNLEYAADGLHINDKGYKYITKELLKYIYEEK